MTLESTTASPLPACLCGGATYRTIYGPYQYTAPGWHGAASVFDVRACERCGLARTRPQPYDDELTADLYQNFPYEDVGLQEALWRGFYAPMLDAAVRHRPGGRLLDVGCGPGLTLKMAAERGYQAAGVEINARSAAYGRDVFGVNVLTSDLAGAGFPPGHFDVVLLSHVVEHLATPRGVFDDIRRVLRPGGVVVIEVPNMGGLQVPLLGARWAGWAPYMHVWQFTPRTLADALGRMGYGVLEVRCRDNLHVGQPRHPLKRLIRQTVLRAVERAASATDRADKVLCVARPAGAPPA